jgi:hypothetical protein
LHLRWSLEDGGGGALKTAVEEPQDDALVALKKPLEEPSRSRQMLLLD